MPSLGFSLFGPLGGSGSPLVLQGSVATYVQPPTAVIRADPEFAVIGSVIRLDGRNSIDPANRLLAYVWNFESVPIGSKMVQEGFRVLDTETDPSAPVVGSPSVVSFSPDVVGEYVVSLKVFNGSYESVLTTKVLSVRAIMVPHGRGLVPDGKFIWSYIRDVWTQVEDREWFETLWSALIQIVGADLLNLYQIDYNKSIRDIQEQVQQRWLSFEPKLLLDQDELSFIFDDQQAGIDASTVRPGLNARAVVVSATEVIVSLGSVLPDCSGQTLGVLNAQNPVNIGSYTIAGLNTARTGYKLVSAISSPASEKVLSATSIFFSLGSTSWVFQGDASSIIVGDAIVFASGPNAGIYTIVTKVGTALTVNKAPPGFSDVTTSVNFKADIYRPVAVTVTQPDEAAGRTFAVPYRSGTNDLSKLTPGRVVVVGGRAFTVSRVQVDKFQPTPVTFVTTETSDVPTDLVGLNWRAAHTLSSKTQNFIELGVNPGDKLVFDLLLSGSEESIEIVAQVIGVDRNSLAFVITDQLVTAGVVAKIPNQTLFTIAAAFDFRTLTQLPDGTISYTDFAKILHDDLSSGAFKAGHFNVSLTPTDSIVSANVSFQIKPKHIIRNRLVPIAENTVSIPMLQQFIKQPELSVNAAGKPVLRRNDQDFVLAQSPVWLSENTDYLVDGEVALHEKLTFRSGSTLVGSPTGDFLDRNVMAGDTFTIESPAQLAGDYTVKAVLGGTQLTLTRPIPIYSLSSLVTAKVKVTRKRSGRFIRFAPGRFTANSPAPDRLWAEVVFFDNSQTVEDNFGLLVGIKRNDLEEFTTTVTYRQAVAGVMFALTSGSAVSKIELGIKILLGLPFAEHRGIIRSIESDFRRDSNGDPILGRLLIEDVDLNDDPRGTVRVYTYPIDTPSKLAGVDVNPVTGVSYAIGDIVERLASLAKGVTITDYTTDPVTSGVTADLLQQFHTFRVRMNDNVFQIEEFDLVSNFLRKITPSYVTYILTTMVEIAELETPLDKLILSLNSTERSVLVDNASLGLPFALALDQKTFFSGVPIARVGDNFYWVRRTGTDLVTAFGSAIATSTSAGFLNPKSGESFDGNLVVPGDKLLVITGLNKGLYSISAVTDTTATASDAPPNGFATATAQVFALLRPINTALLRSGSASVANGVATVTLGAGLRTDGVRPGDFIVFDHVNITSRNRPSKVVSVDFTGGLWQQVTITPSPVVTAGPVTSNFRVYRPAFYESPSSEVFSVTSAGGNTLTTTSGFLKALLDPGDELQVQAADLRRVTVIDPVQLFITPVLAVGTYNVALVKKRRSPGTLNLNQLDFNDPADPADVTVAFTGAANAVCTATSNDVAIATNGPFELFARPGDFFVIVGGTNGGVDVGYGAGVYPIRSLSAGHVLLTVNLTASETRQWKVVKSR